VLSVSAGAEARAIDALVFYSRSLDVVTQTAPPKPARPIDVSRVPALAAPAAQRALTPFLGKDINQRTLDGLRDAVQSYFTSIKQPFVAVVFPAQDVTQGVLQVLVTQSRLGAVRVVGNNWFDSAQYSDAIRTRRGQLLDSDKLNADVEWINRNQYRHASLEASPGQFPGTTDLTIRAQDRFPVSFNVGINNAGNPSTGLTQLTTGFDWGNAFFRGDDLNYTYTTTPNGSSLQQHSLYYQTSVPSRALVTLSGTYSTSQTTPVSLFNSTGISSQLSPRYVASLFSVGLDYKSTNNNLLFGGTSVFPTTTKIYDFALAYTPTETDRLGSTSFTFGMFLSPGGWGNANSDAAFTSQQPGAQARYAYMNANVVRTFNFNGGESIALHVTAQMSNAILLPSEQLNFGYPNVRGFSSSFATRDDGVILSLQVAPRAFPLGFAQALHIPTVRDQIAPFAFIDYGTGWNQRDLNGISTYLRMMTVGPGFTYQMGRNLTGRFDYGFVVQRFGVPAPGGQADLALQLHT
jgi:hemolysin activation/secretion protein